MLKSGITVRWLVTTILVIAVILTCISASVILILKDYYYDTVEAKLETITEGAQVNILETIKINGVTQTITDKAIDIPIATDTLLGVVMGSTTENKISIAEDGTMEVNSVNVNKLTQTDGEYLIMNGGSASI